MVHNRVHGNGLPGILDSSGNNLILGNLVAENGRGIFSERRFGGSAILKNEVRQNRRDGILLNTGRHIVADNMVEHNILSGVHVRGAFGIVEQNKIIGNHRNGVLLTEHAHGNLILRNTFSDNVPFDIKLINSDNTVIENQCLRSSPPGLCRNRSNGVSVIHVPRDFRTISAAVAAAKKGDTILVKNGVYRERMIIPFSKSAIRIIADGNNVVLDGNKRHGVAFAIVANNVEINGFVIRNYVNAGIRVTGIDSKLIGNEILNITQGNGIELKRSFSTLVWKNRICKAKLDAINMVGMNSWIIDNDLSQNGRNAIRTNEVTTWGNAIVENRIENNGADGILDGAGFNLIFNNEIRDNRSSGVHEHAGVGYACILGNVIAHNVKNGVNLKMNGTIVRNSSVQNDKQTGIRIHGELNTVEKNRISNNNHYGILLTMEAKGNLVLRNQLTGNTPANIKVNNRNNTLIQNQRLRNGNGSTILRN